DRRAPVWLHVPHATDSFQQKLRRFETRAIIPVNVCPHFGVPRVSEVTVDVMSCVRVDAAPAELRQRIEVVDVHLARLQYQIFLKLGNVRSRRVDPSIVRELSGGLLNTHEASMSLLQTVEKELLIGE